MRLTDLEPRWITFSSNGARCGLTFLCPHCRTARLGAWFHDPYCGVGYPVSEWPLFMLQHPDLKFWARTGEDFDTLTLSPSVDASSVGHWHGTITNGEVS